MAKCILTNKAVLDLSSIWEYTVNTWSESQADKYYFMLIDTCQEMADGKVKGKNYTEINAEILGIRIGEHIIFYRTLGIEQIEIIRVLHQQMDLKNRIGE